MTFSELQVPGNAPSEAALASRKTLDTVKAAEQIIEALDACREEKAKELVEPDQVCFCFWKARVWFSRIS